MICAFTGTLGYQHVATHNDRKQAEAKDSVKPDAQAVPLTASPDGDTRTPTIATATKERREEAKAAVRCCCADARAAVVLMPTLWHAVQDERKAPQLVSYQDDVPTSSMSLVNLWQRCVLDRHGCWVPTPGLCGCGPCCCMLLHHRYLLLYEFSFRLLVLMVIGQCTSCPATRCRLLPC